MLKFLVDECIGITVFRWLKQEGYNVVAVCDVMPGATDDAVLAYAYSLDCVLITSDKDFGDMIFKTASNHVGVILLRLVDQRPDQQIKTLKRLLVHHKRDLKNNFVVASELMLRIVQC